MKDIADILREFAGGDEELAKLIRSLREAQTTETNMLWREFLRRIARSAGVPEDNLDTGPKALLELMSAADDNDTEQA